ncbi:hypothetical protein QBC44DRAFT_379521 [Cladorrhinum sp. PSN332]|nr:hypothetical protein QBC44DRAFT_379521 [Cladorrhinum sp. PSN332]
MFHLKIELSPLANRAWAFQERLLARRVIHFCSDIVLFECDTIQASELHANRTEYESEPYLLHGGKLMKWLQYSLLTSPKSVGTQSPNSGKWAVREMRGALDVLQSLGCDKKQTFGEKVEFYKRWFEVISAYSKGELTRQTNKLVAIAGVAELVQGRADLPYLAGLRDSEMLPLGLLWVVKNPQERLGVYCAPSWSWASVKGRIGLSPRALLEQADRGNLGDDLKFESTVEKAQVFHKNEPVSNARNLVDGGKLRLDCETASCELSDDGMLDLRGVDGSNTSLPWLAGWHFDGKMPMESIIVHVLKAQSTTRIRSYGLVLR